MNIKKVITYGFNVTLNQENGNIFYWNFHVLAENWSDAQKILEKYLSEPNKTGLIYKDVINIKQIQSENIIINLDMNLEILNEN